MRVVFALLLLSCSTERPRAVELAPVKVDVPPAPPPRPVKVKRSGEQVWLSDDWLMRETEPMLVPDTEPRPVTILFHAICADPQWHCEWMQYFDLAPQWQICPRAPGRCDGGGYKWSKPALPLVQAALAKTKERHPGRVKDDSLVLVGFSNGGYAVASLLRTHALPVKGIVIHGAEASFDAKDLKDIRIVFTAGELDGAAPFMKAQAKRLAAQGIEARWVSLGQQGHFISVDSGKEVAQMIDWSRAR